MLEGLNYKRKQVLMAVFTILLFYAAYELSFEKAINAISLNRQLKTEGGNNTEQSVSDLTKRKNEFYKSVVKRYKVKSEDREIHLWQSLSGMAIANKIEISFKVEKDILSDTSVINKVVVTDQFTFKGNYFNLIKLLDTISKTRGIGGIYWLKLQSEKSSDQKDKREELTLIIRVKGIVN